MVTAVYSGTFDPFHWGHLEVVKKALDHATEVAVVINPIASHKKPASYAHRRRLAEVLLATLVAQGGVRLCDNTEHIRQAFEVGYFVVGLDPLPIAQNCNNLVTVVWIFVTNFAVWETQKCNSELVFGWSGASCH